MNSFGVKSLSKCWLEVCGPRVCYLVLTYRHTHTPSLLTLTHTLPLTHTLSHTHTPSLSHTHRHTLTHTHTHTHTHTLPLSLTHTHTFSIMFHFSPLVFFSSMGPLLHLSLIKKVTNFPEPPHCLQHVSIVSFFTTNSS